MSDDLNYCSRNMFCSPPSNFSMSNLCSQDIEQTEVMQNKTKISRTKTFTSAIFLQNFYFSSTFHHFLLPITRFQTIPFSSLLPNPLSLH